MASRAATLLLVCAVCALGGAASAAAQAGDAPSCTSAPSAIPGGPGHRPIRGWAFIGRGYELSNASVSLRTVRGRRIPGGSARTGPTGAFTLSPLARALPRTFVVTVRGRFVGGRRLPRPLAFSALVRRRDLGRVVYVGPASTVLRHYVRAHPGVTDRTAATRVRRMLGIPAWHNLGYDLYNISGRWYSAGRIMRRAAHRGGMNRLVTALVRAANRGSPDRPRFGESERALSALGAEPYSSAWFVQQLAGGVVSAVGSEGAGWVFDQIGFTTTPAYVDEIESQLNQLAAEMSQLEDAIYALNAAVQESYFAQQSDNLTAARAALDTAMEDLAYIPGIADDEDREYWSQIDFCQDIKPLATNQKPWGSTRVLIDQVLVDVPPGEKPLGLQGAVYMESQDPLWSYIDSQNTWQIVDYWTQYAAEALDVYLEYQHEVGGEQHCDSPPTDAGCPLQKEVDQTNQLGVNALATLKDAHGTPLNRMVDGYTYDMRSGLMWCMFCWPYAQTPFNANAQLSVGLYDGLPVLSSTYYMPTYAQVQGLMSGCGCGPGNPTGVQWLVDKAGLAPSWLDAPKLPQFPPGVYVMVVDTYVEPFDLRTMSNEVDSSLKYYPQYFLPARGTLASELPFFP